MTPPPSSRLGPYEILGPLGAGGMGEVYRAKDVRLDRTVAIKILPRHVIGNPSRHQRFEREARAVSRLSHPHICTLYDVGQHDDVHFIVTECLDGETLATRLERGPLPIAQAIRYAIEIADALSHAHRQGIVHRDLKPSNIMLTRSGAKLLDFGVASVREPEPPAGAARTHSTATQSVTDEGTILGTVQYMAPEQLEGRATDARADIFALGAVVYEMVTGRPAFEGSSKASLIAAILEHDPPPLAATRRHAGSGRAPLNDSTPQLDHVVTRCLAKDPEERWQTAADVRQELAWIAQGGPAVAAPAAAASRGIRAYLAWLVALLVGALAALSYVAVRPDSPSPMPETWPSFKQLTFRRGYVTNAQFSSDGQTIIYSAAWDGGPVQIFETRAQGPESRRLSPLTASVESVSSSNELALITGCRLDWGNCVGTLARMPLSGGAPRELVLDAVSADWTPDGRSLAVIRIEGGSYRLEFPIGKTLYSTAGKLRWLSFSPQGDRLTFIEYPQLSDESGAIKVVDLAGRAETLSSGWKFIRGLQWSRDGGEIWFTASRSGMTRSLYAISLAGELRLILRAPGDIELLDVGRDGRVLLGQGSARSQMIWSRAGAVRELSWLDWSTVADLSADGQTVLFYEWGEGVGATPVVYLRKADGSDAVRLGDGKALTLSPDGRWALALVESEPPQLILLPTGTGESRLLPVEGLSDVYWAKWFPDAQRILLVAARSDTIPGSFVLDTLTGRLEPVAETGMLAMLVSPDGQRILARDPLGAHYLWPVGGGEPVIVEGLEPGDRPVQWSADGRLLYVRGEGENLVRIYRYSMTTQRRELWQELTPRDPAGVFGIATGRGELAVTPDGQGHAFTQWVMLSDLFLVDGVRP